MNIELLKHISNELEDINNGLSNTLNKTIKFQDLISIMWRIYDELDEVNQNLKELIEQEEE